MIINFKKNKMKRKGKIILFACIMISNVCFSQKKVLDSVDSLFTIEKTALLTIGRSDCDVCDYLIGSDYYKALMFGKKYFDILASDENKLLSQALYTYSFPSVYVINSEYEILGVVCGAKNFGKVVDAVCQNNEKIYDEYFNIKNIDKNLLPKMIAYSLRSLRNYVDGDIEQMKKNAEASLSKGSYFFNNYLLYLAYKKEKNTDSMRKYKKNALKHADGINAYIYDNLIEELKK
jgi:hypothetical protein